MRFHYDGSNMDVSTNKQRKVNSIKLIAVSVVILLLLSFVVSGAVKVYRLKNEMRLMEQRISTLETKNNSLSELILKLRDDSDTIQREIRKRLGRIMPDETIVIFPGESNEVPSEEAE